MHPHTHTQRPLPLTSLNCPVCRRRYKTASSLKAHHTQNHPGEPFPPSLEEKVPVILPPPPNLQGKELAKPNPYCDFCLGDSTGNKKTSKPEKMVSCADCGRSGKWEGERHGRDIVCSSSSLPSTSLLYAVFCGTVSCCEDISLAVY